MKRTYYWYGLSKSGEYCKGAHTAASSEEIACALRKDAIVLISCKPSYTARFLHALASLHRTAITPELRIMLYKSLSDLLDAGMVFQDALAALSVGQSRQFASLLEKVRALLLDGYSVVEALSGAPEVFTAHVIALVKAVDGSGRLAEVLRQASQVQEDYHSYRSEVQKAIFIPLVTLAGALCVITITLMTIVPLFSSLFEHADGDMPYETLRLIMVSKWLTAHGGTLLIAISSVLCGFLLLTKWQAGATWWQRAREWLRYKTPFFGRLWVLADACGVLLSLGVLLRAGVRLVHALPLAAAVPHTKLWQEDGEKMVEALKRGDDLEDVIYAPCHKLLPALAQNILLLGRQRSELSAVCFHAAGLLVKEKQRLMRLHSTCLPLILSAVVGISIFFIVKALYFPLFTMLGQVKV